MKIVLSLLLCLISAYAYGQNNIESKQQHLQEFEKKISDQKERLKNLLEKEGSILDVLKQLEQKEAKLVEEISKLDQRIKRSINQIKNREHEIQKLEKSIELRNESISKQLGLMYKHGELNYLKIILGAEDLSQIRRSQWLLSRWMESDKKDLDEFHQDVLLLQKEKKQLETEKKNLEESRKNRQTQKEKLAKEKDDRSKVLFLVQNQKDFYLKSIRELEKSAKNLQKLINQLQKSQSQSGSGFVAMKGHLILPVKGKIEKHYGSYFDQKLGTKLYHKGIDIRAKRSENIYNVFDGEVLFVDWFDGYGRIVIVDHGSGFFSLYAHLDKIFVKKGQQVVVGDVLATVGDTGSLKGDYLYFELRQKGISIDPMPWFEKN
ncbi:MAG: peptidoglycan DD-metalloendopeptidase family protein [Bdellovibrionales bacterium]|nr:peptidoglycan DD-metalloendopeptidase family protein [Bdellovibrionales bacterium]